MSVIPVRNIGAGRSGTHTFQDPDVAGRFSDRQNDAVARTARQWIVLEAFNLLNTVTPGNPQTTRGSSDFGRVTALAGGTAPRVIQLGAKYQF